MGNKVPKPRDKSASEVLFPQTSSRSSVSVTIPSVCTSPSFHLSAKKSTSETSSEVFNWSQMQSLYLQQEDFTTEYLTPAALKGAAVVVEVLKYQLNDICAEIYNGTLKMPDAIQESFVGPSGMKGTQSNLSAMSNSPATLKKTIIHFVSVIDVHMMILEFLKYGEVDKALDLIKQIAVSHALKGMNLLQFRVLDWFIIHYLIKNKLITDDSINSITSYLNVVSNYIEKYFESQSVNFKKSHRHSGKKNHRKNKARENYRLMKKWKILIQRFKANEGYVDTILEEQARLRQAEEDQSIDTLTLKKSDFIMKHFVKNEHEGLDLDDQQIEIHPALSDSGSSFSNETGGNQSTSRSVQKTASATATIRSDTKSGSKHSAHKNFFM